MFGQDTNGVKESGLKIPLFQVGFFVYNKGLNSAFRESSHDHCS